jgi:Cu(I)/Ag(I) efflux system membrane fusion protein
VLLDAYESDIALIHYGQQVQLDVPAFPGRSFTGFVAYVAPDLTERTRTIKVRLNVPNPDGRLRPGMFAHALLEVSLTASGEAYGPELAGKFICPMHPEITGMSAEPCAICRMDLEPAGALDPIHTRTNITLPLVIPDTAPLITGRRAVVYVQLADTDRSTFEGRSIKLGPRAGGHYLVLDGLKEGERVVTHGNFKIDSELQIRGRPSMMSAPDNVHTSPPPAVAVEKSNGVPSRGPVEGVPASFGQQIAPIVRDYLGLVDGLAGDDFPRAKVAATAMGERLRAIEASVLPAPAAQAWQELAGSLSDSLESLSGATDVGGLRQHLASLTRDMERVVIGFSAGQVETLYRAHCPMALDNRGADWLQAGEQITNPYFGSKMFRCGEITGRIP